jgi:glycosyltransferase involved in cell wall biosynthesis
VDPQNPSIAIIIPAFNEEQTIGRVIEDFHQELPNASIFIINNCSTDQTANVAQAALEKINGQGKVLHEPRKGKGFAVRKAFHQVYADIFVIADGDLQCPASAVHDLIRPIIESECDIVCGNRFANRQYQQHNVRPFHASGNMLVRHLINLIFRKKFQDMMCGYRACNRFFVKNFPIMSTGFELEVEMTLHALDKRFRIQEVPIDFQAREEGSDSKLHTLRDGTRVLRLIFTLFKNYRPLAFFSLVGLVFFFLPGLAFGSYVLLDFFRAHHLNHIQMAVLSVGLMIFSLLFFAIGVILDSMIHWQKFNFEHRILNHSSALQSHPILNSPKRRAGDRK